MFLWETPQAAKRVASPKAYLPPIPYTGWTPPKEFPRLDNVKVVAFDTETYDPELLDYGAGWARGKSHMVGFSLATDDAAWYWPLRHEVQTELNVPVEPAMAFLKDILENPRIHKVGANLLYDVGNAREVGIVTKGSMWDVQYAEALLTEDASVALDVLAGKYLNDKKDYDLMYRWLADAYGGDTKDQRKNIYRCPPSLVGAYGEADARLPLAILKKQWAELASQELLDLFRLECELIPLYVEMRMLGVSVDVDKLPELYDKLTIAAAKVDKQITDLVGFSINPNASAEIANGFQALGFPYATTEKGAPSFTKELLNASECPLAGLIIEHRKVLKMRDTFVVGIEKAQVGGKLFPQHHPLRKDGGGTRSGRYSCTAPNTQQIPSRDPVWAKPLRSLFIPDAGHKQIRKYDYQAIEYRMLAHFAVGSGADAVRAQYNRDPETDYHNFVMDMVAPVAGWDISTEEGRSKWRKPLKVVNFMLVFGGGKNKLIRSLGLEQSVGEALYDAYHNAIPYAKATMESAAKEAEETGCVRTILKRKSRFELYEPKVYADDAVALPLRAALAKYGYGNIRMAKLHKALNRRLQGSAADLLKKALHTAYYSGVFDEVGVPRLLVHDECVYSDQGTATEEAWNEMQHIFETAIPLKVPILFEPEQGSSWGHTKS